MKKYICEYRAYIKNILNENNDRNFCEILKYHSQQILFFQHERLIHLIVTVLISIILVLSIFAIIIFKVFQIIPLAILLLILIVPYIMHYYFLENQVQGLYEDYNKLYEKAFGFNYKSNKSK